MDEIDAIVADVLREMRCDPMKPPHWVPRVHKDGYVCSRCGKHTWWEKEKCDGCHAVMGADKHGK